MTVKQSKEILALVNELLNDSRVGEITIEKTIANSAEVTVVYLFYNKVKLKE